MIQPEVFTHCSKQTASYRLVFLWKIVGQGGNGAGCVFGRAPTDNNPGQTGFKDTKAMTAQYQGRFRKCAIA